MIHHPASRASAPPLNVLLCADDYALTDGVSQAIEELARAGRLSATSVMVTTPHWPAHAVRIAPLRARIAIGLHLNFTLGRPLAPMPGLAPDSRFPVIANLTARSLRGAVDAGEIADETGRQLAAFETALGHPPDFLDGHQHVHGLPFVRAGVLAALQTRYPDRRLLIRDPGDSLVRILKRGVAVSKAATLAALSSGFAGAVRRAGFPKNDSFAGVSDFSPATTGREFTRGLLAPGRLHLMMCHPGFPDAELAAIDPVTSRRRVEFDVLMRDEAWPRRIWHPSRESDGPPIDWRAEGLAA